MNEAMKLLDNGWRIVLYRGGLGEYVALAVSKSTASIDDALRSYMDYEPEIDGLSSQEAADALVFSGENRLGGGGLTPEEAVRSCVEKVLFRRLPDEEVR